jgi:hypothetical protein
MDGFASQTLKTLRSLYEAAFSVANRAPAFDGVSTPQPSSIALHEVVPTGYRVDHAGEARRFVQESQSLLLLFASSLVFIYLGAVRQL